jgi:hypothetical protein
LRRRPTTDVIMRRPHGLRRPSHSTRSAIAQGSVGGVGRRQTLARGGRTDCGVQGPHTCQGVPSPRGCDAGLAVHSEPSCKRAKLPQGRCRSYCIGEACVGGFSPFPTLPLHWSMQHPSRAQFFCRGGSHPPRTFAGGASYANSDEVGASDLSLLLGGVVHYALLNGTSYSLPLPIQPRWVHSLFGGRECPSIPNVLTYSSTAEAHTTQAPSSSCLPPPWPSGSQSTGASSLRAVTSAPRSQPIYW